jgi:hypothetical protein
MPMKRAQLAKMFRMNRRPPTCLTALGLWTFGRIENQEMGIGCSNSSAGAAKFWLLDLTEKLADDASDGRQRRTMRGPQSGTQPQNDRHVLWSGSRPSAAMKRHPHHPEKFV